MITKIDAILSLVPGAECCVRGEVVEWIVQPVNKPTDSQITTELSRLQNIDDSNKFREKSDLSEAKAYAKLTTLKNMSPSQIQTWATTNVTTLAQARDAITTLAIAVSILSRKL